MNINTKLFVISEAIFVSAFGLIYPIFAIFVTNHITNGNLLTVGIATTIHQLGKSLLIIPLNKYCDEKKCHKMFTITGYFMMSIVPFTWLWITSVQGLMLVEVYFAFASALGRAGWYTSVSKTIPSGQEGKSWSNITAYTGIGGAIAAYIGGVLVTAIGFELTFTLIGILSLIASGILTRIEI